MQHERQYAGDDGGSGQRPWYCQQQDRSRHTAQFCCVEPERGVEQQRRQEHKEEHARIELRQTDQVGLFDDHPAHHQRHGVRQADAPGEHADARRAQQHPGKGKDGGLDVDHEFRLAEPRE